MRAARLQHARFLKALLRSTQCDCIRVSITSEQEDLLANFAEASVGAALAAIAPEVAPTGTVAEQDVLFAIPGMKSCKQWRLFRTVAQLYVEHCVLVVSDGTK